MMERMRYRKLGRTNMEVSEIGYGAWGIGGKQWLGGSDEESVAALERAIELGLNFIDTALAYGDGHSEKLVGKVAKGAKKKVKKAMHERKHGTLKSGKSGKKVKSRKQAIAIALSESGQSRKRKKAS